MFGVQIMATPKIKELIESITSLLPNNTEGVKDDFKDNLKILLNDYLRKINVVTREEFDTQNAVLKKTRSKLDEIEKKLKGK
jgi:BMFP domain-containing protein YqiC